MTNLVLVLVLQVDKEGNEMLQDVSGAYLTTNTGLHYNILNICCSPTSEQSMQKMQVFFAKLDYLFRKIHLISTECVKDFPSFTGYVRWWLQS